MLVKLQSSWLSSLLLVGLAVGCGDSPEQSGGGSAVDTSDTIELAEGECRKDTDCGDGQLCLAKKCVSPNTPGSDGSDGAPPDQLHPAGLPRISEFE